MAKRNEVKDEDLVLVLSAFTRGGAFVLLKRYRDKLGAMVLEEPMQREDEMWVFMVSNPFVEGLRAS